MSQAVLIENLTVDAVAPATPLGDAQLALNNAHARELSWLTPEQLQHLVGQAFDVRRSRWIRMPTTRVRISSGSAPAIRVLSMSTASWSRRRRAGAAMRVCSIAICSNMR